MECVLWSLRCWRRKSTAQKHTEREKKHHVGKLFQQTPVATGTRPFCGRHCRYFLGIIIRCALVLNAFRFGLENTFGAHSLCARACKASKWAALFGKRSLCRACPQAVIHPHDPARLMRDYYGPDPAARRRTGGQTEPLRGAVGFVCVCWLWQRSRSCHSRRHL